MSALPLKQALLMQGWRFCRYGCEACHCQGIESPLLVVGPQLEMR